jgi:hypothetical protein
MTIPHPDNPQHTDNLASIPLLEAQGWQGADASLEISVFEYDFAWRELEEPDEHGDDHVFLYRITHRTPPTFDRLMMRSTLDLRKEYDWVDWPSFLSTVGLNAEEWDAQPFAIRIYDLMNVHGYENIFGSSYWEGFTIKQP